MDFRWYESLEWWSKTERVNVVLFVCSANVCRSPAAEYFFKKLTSWWIGIDSKSRGLYTNEILQAENIREIAIHKESKRVLGDPLCGFLETHRATQIAESDIAQASIVLAMGRSARDKLRKMYPAYAYKIFTLKGFVNETDDHFSADLEVTDPFDDATFVKIRDNNITDKEYYDYLKKYVICFDDIQRFVRRLIHVLYLVNGNKGHHENDTELQRHLGK